MSRAGRSAISPSTSGCTRSGLLDCLEEGQGREPEGTAGAGTVSHNLGQGFRVALQRSPVLVGRGHGTGGTDLRGLEVVGRPLPALRVRQEVANGDSRVDQQEVVELPDVIDLSDDEIDLEVDRALAQQDTTAASQSRISLSDDEMDMLISISLNTTVDLTRSPERPVLSHTQNTTSPGCSTVPHSSPSLSTIQCPVCLDSLSTIRSKGKTIWTLHITTPPYPPGNHLLSTTCGHVFCSFCLPESIKRDSKCPTCRKRLTSTDYHELFLQ